METSETASPIIRSPKKLVTPKEAFTSLPSLCQADNTFVWGLLQNVASGVTRG